MERYPEDPHHFPDTPVVTAATIDEYRSIARSQANGVSIRTIEITFSDGDVVICACDGTWLACEETVEEARKQAAFLLSAYANGAFWAELEIPRYRGHLQRCFPEIFARHGMTT